MEVLLLILIIAGFVGYIVYQDKQYKKTAYYQVTQNPYDSIASRNLRVFCKGNAPADPVTWEHLNTVKNQDIFRHD